jgi:hypothetical protein
LYFTGFGRKSIKFQDYNEVSKLTFWIDSIPINFEFKEREVAKKFVIFGKNPE